MGAEIMSSDYEIKYQPSWRDAWREMPLSVLLVIVFFAVSVILDACNPVHALDYGVMSAAGNYPLQVVGPFSPYVNAADAQVYQNAGIQVNQPAAAIVNNPQGVVAKVVNGAAVMESAIPVQVVPPAGAVPSAATSSAALAAAGGAGALASSGLLVKTAPLAAAAASSMGKVALGVGAGAAAFLGSPALIGGLMALQVGMAGYQLYQGLTAQNIVLNADGSASAVVPASSIPQDSKYYLNPWPGLYFTTMADTCLYDQQHYLGGFRNGYSIVGVTSTGFTCQLTLNGANAGGDTAVIVKYCQTGYTYSAGMCNRAGSSSPATNAQVGTAIDTAAVAPAVAADIANYAISQAVPLPVGIAPSSPALSLASPFAELKSSIDSLGNVTKTLERNIVNFSPVAPGGAPVITPQRESVTVINSSPTAVTTTSLAPLIGTAVAASQQQATKDLCVDHPDILACADLAKLNDVPLSTTLDKTVDLGTLSPVAIGSVAVCPAPLVLPPMMGRTMTLDIWSPICSYASIIKAFNIAAASLFCMYMLIGGVRQNG